MNVRDIDYFIAVAETKSVSRAAERCHVSQPSLSIQLRKLEELFNLKLFNRAGRKMQLTAQGEELLERAYRLRNEWRSMLELADQLNQREGQSLKLGAFPTLAPYLFPQIIPPLIKAQPQLRLQLVEQKSSELVEQLKRGELDAALLALPQGESDLQATPLFSERFLLAVPEQHELAAQQQVQQSDLDGHELMLMGEGHCLREQTLSLCELAGAREREQYRGSSLETLRHMVAAQMGITLIPQLAVHERLAGVRYIPFAAPQPQRQIALVWRSGSSQQQRLEQLALWIRDNLAHFSAELETSQ